MKPKKVRQRVLHSETLEKDPAAKKNISLRKARLYFRKRGHSEQLYRFDHKA